jgi:sulfate adenylyltransferase subunit 2
MYEFRDKMAAEAGMELLVWQNPEALELGINPFDHGSALHTDVWKTEGLKQALDHYGFDCAFGGRAARRGEVPREGAHLLDSAPRSTVGPKQQRPELWRVYNVAANQVSRSECSRCSNWTELDVWLYIHREGVPIVPLYLVGGAPGRRARRHADHGRRRPHALRPGEEPELRSVRFRTLGCYPLTGAVESTAATLTEVSRRRCSRPRPSARGVIDHDQSGSMEKKKQEGYF